MRDYLSFRASEMCIRRKEPKISLKKGDVIVESKAFAYVVENERRGQYCEYCLLNNKFRNLIPCKNCLFHFYCSQACQQQSWDEFHKHECEPLKKFFKKNKDSSIPNFARLLARIIFKLKEGGEKIEEKYSSNRGRKFKDLMNHYKDIKNDPNRMKDVNGLIKILSDYIGEDNVPNESDFIGIYGRVLVNRFCLNDELNVPIGSAVYLAASIFDHSCMPNAHPSFVGKKLFVRTLVDVPLLNLDKVRISYVDCINGTDMRRQDLFKNWYFWCDCDLCNSQERKHYENFMICENPMCDEHISVPERYSQIEPMAEINKNKDEDSSVALKKALTAAKVQYNFANVPLNPFASSDAMMAYLFYDKNRYQMAPDSDLTECTDDSPSNTPPRQLSPEPSTSGNLDTNGDHISNGTDVPEEYPPMNSSDVPEKKGKQGENESNSAVNGISNEADELPSLDGSVKKKKLLKKKASKKLTEESELEPETGSKKKKFSKKKSTLKGKETNEEIEAHDVVTNGNENLTNGDESYTNGSENLINGTENLSNGTKNLTNGNENLTNGFSCIHEREEQHMNGYAAEEEADRNDVKLTGKKKKLVKRQVFEKSDVLCKGCNCYVDRNSLREYRSAVSFTIQRLKDVKEDNPNFLVVLDVLDRQGNLLPKLNVWRVRTVDFAFNAAFVNGAFVLAMKYGLENSDGMKFLYGDNHPTLGLFYMKMAKVHMALSLHRKGLEFVQMAKAILVIAMGPEHPFIKRDLEGIEQMAEDDPEIAMERRIARRKQKEADNICPCCGKNKCVHKNHLSRETEKPWERDLLFKQQFMKDSEYFHTNEFAMY